MPTTLTLLPSTAMGFLIIHLSPLSAILNVQETFISTDDLRINLWNVNISNEAFGKFSLFPANHSPSFSFSSHTIGIVDIKPENMDELTEVITCADFHPQLCNVLIYATSKGVIRMGDLRQSALCEKYAKGTLCLFPASRSHLSQSMKIRNLTLAASSKSWSLQFPTSSSLLMATSSFRETT